MASTQPAREILGTFPERLLMVLMSGNFRGLLGDQQKIDNLMKKKCFLGAIVLVLHIYYCFLLEKQICKSSRWGRPRDVYRTQLQNVPGTK